MDNQYGKLITVTRLLREERRVKIGLDWQYTLKYGQLRILCDYVWQEVIEEYLVAAGIKVTQYLTYYNCTR